MATMVVSPLSSVIVLILISKTNAAPGKTDICDFLVGKTKKREFPFPLECNWRSLQVYRRPYSLASPKKRGGGRQKLKTTDDNNL